jgi:hypothetical protein
MYLSPNITEIEMTHRNASLGSTSQKQTKKIELAEDTATSARVCAVRYDPSTASNMQTDRLQSNCSVIYISWPPLRLNIIMPASQDRKPTFDDIHLICE